MRYVIGLLVLTASAVSMANEAQLKQWAKMDRCSHAAYISVKVLESDPDESKQALALQGSINGLKKNTKLGEATPTEKEILGTYSFLTRIALDMPRPYANREHDWLIAQGASACSLWIPDEQA